MKLHLISAAVAGMLWACPGSAFQTARPFVSRATAPRHVNIGPLMDSAATEVKELEEGGLVGIAAGAIGETSELSEDQAETIAAMLGKLEALSELTGKQKTADGLLLAQLFFRLSAKDLSRGQSAAELNEEFLELGTQMMVYYGAIANSSKQRTGGTSSFTGGSNLAKLLRETLQKALRRPATIDYATYPVYEEYPNVQLSGMMKMVKGVPSVEYWFSFKKFVRVITRALRSLAGVAVNPLTADDVSTKKNYERIFKAELSQKYGIEGPNLFLPMPEYTFNHWTEDQEFARQFLNGVNPVMIEVVKDSAKLTPELLDFFKQEGDVDIDALAKSNKLFYVNYIGLADLTTNPHQAYPEAYNNPTYTNDTAILDRVGKEPRYFKAPMIVFRKTEDLKNIEIMAIQLDRGAGSKVYTADNSGDMEWLFAKETVATADSQYHEWVSHLGKTHLTMEPHIVAIHNTLRQENHKVYPFVRPMCRDTLLLNYAARQTLAKFGPDSFGDYMTSVGTGQFMQLILKYWESYDFFKSSAFDEELESRGFTDDVTLANYRYRTDGQKIWGAYGRFATQYVDECYTEDAEVASDTGLQKWATETTGESTAAIKGFPKKFESKAQLAKTLQTLFWLCSGLHAAVNYPQYDYYAYQANKPLGIRKSFEEWKEANGSEDWMFEEAMPLLDKAQEAAVTVQLLTLPSEHTILDLDYCFETYGKDAYAAFKEELKTISSQIDARNEEDALAGEPKYEYLKPENVPASVDI